MPKLRHTLLAVALLFGQWALLAHETNIHAHKSGQPCEFCLFGSHLDHASLPEVVAVRAPLFTCISELPQQNDIIARSSSLQDLRARGPPSLLFS